MNTEKVFAVSFATVLCVLIIAILTHCYLVNRQIVAMVENGANPILAGCAVKVEDTRAECIVAMYTMRDDD